MAAPFPHHYEVTLAGAGDGGGALAAAGRPPILGGAPPEFDGRQEWWSPEHLLLASVTLCLMTTLQALAARARVPLARYGSHISATLDKTAAGLVFTEIVATMEVAVAEEHRERVAGLIDSAKKHCIISNALSVPVAVTASVTAA
ncbi:MAG TPA: OsmC family protein [Vicinamibacteria bacterium]|nr:OsmC family protein [Vicinamibacteria bacterium]